MERDPAPGERAANLVCKWFGTRMRIRGHRRRTSATILVLNKIDLGEHPGWPRRRGVSGEKWRARAHLVSGEARVSESLADAGDRGIFFFFFFLFFCFFFFFLFFHFFRSRCLDFWFLTF